MRLALLAFILCGCGAGWHLKQAEKHLKKAELKGAVISSDTVFIENEVIRPEIRFDTVVRLSYDTFHVEHNKVVTRIKIDTVSKKVFIQTTCPPDTVRIRVPVTVTSEIKAGTSGLMLWLWLFIAALAGVLLVRLFSR